MPRSHNCGYSLAARVWMERFWQPVNRLGYRDVEHVLIPGRKNVFALGDSFTAGHGTARAADRFADLLEAQHPALHVLNLGRNGSDTADELARLRAHPLHPDAIVLQYYPNDIEEVAQRGGRRLPAFAPYADLARVLRPVVSNSFLLDFVYWQFPHTDELEYVRFLDHALADTTVMRRHLADLDAICAFADERHVALVAVVFPILQDLARSRVMTAPVEALFRAHGCPVVAVADLVEDLPVAARTVNAHDAHPSLEVHARVAAVLGAVLDPR